MNEFAWNLVQVVLDEDDLNLYNNNKTHKIQCSEIHFGVFDTRMKAAEFITKHNKNANCFFILESWVMNPTHVGQCETWLTIYSYDYNGLLICGQPTHRFVLHHNDLYGTAKTEFLGRDEDQLIGKVGDIVLCYDDYKKQLYKARILGIPVKNENVNMEWYDDSYMVKPLRSKINHEHVQSTFVFKKDFFSSNI